MGTLTEDEIREELTERLNRASEEDMDEFDFFREVFEDGYTIEDFRTISEAKYEWAKEHCENLGLA